MKDKVEINGLGAILIFAIYVSVSVLGLRYGIYLGFDKDIGILSPVILVFTYYWLSIVHMSGKKK